MVTYFNRMPSSFKIGKTDCFISFREITKRCQITKEVSPAYHNITGTEFMAGKLPFRIGRSGRARLRKASPFATLLLELATSMTQEDVANFKMVLIVDKLSSKRHLSQIKHAADIFHLLHNEDIISPENMKFIQDIFIKLGRKDLDTMIERYLMKQNQHKENQETVPKQVNSGPSYTQLKAKGSSTEVVGVRRTFPDGLSAGHGRDCTTVLTASQNSNSQLSAVLTASQDNNSQLSAVLPASQGNNSRLSAVLTASQDNNSQLSQMSISDDDKIEQSEWKLCNLDIEDTIMASQ